MKIEKMRGCKNCKYGKKVGEKCEACDTFPNFTPIISFRACDVCAHENKTLEDKLCAECFYPNWEDEDNGKTQEH